jgi:hypothetical protein
MGASEADAFDICLPTITKVTFLRVLVNIVLSFQIEFSSNGSIFGHVK